MIDWDIEPLSTHYHEGWDVHYTLVDGVWYVSFGTMEETLMNKSHNLYENPEEVANLISRGPTTRAEMLAAIQEHFTKIGELLDYLDVKLPEHEAAQTKAKGIV